ncbi:hypothetical protein G3260_002155 [Streptomyces albus]|uniref:hypothetical protein n=1 Tax=Streptomyces albus TaxID=1888 RepID=UPI0013B47B54|nr:hypothetical protein [Streptomyces albus]QID36077.1 hypothetical protein G3260_002155 [Streptomyces albus]
MSEGTATLDVEQAEVALVAHYARLVRLAYCVLGDGPRHARAAHTLAQRALPRRRTTTDGLPRAQGEDDAAYAWLRLRVVRAALDRPRPPLPGHRGRNAPARAAYALRHLEGMADPEIRRLLDAARVRDPEAALADARTVTVPVHAGPCALCAAPAAHPLTAVRRRRRGRAALAALCAALACGGLLGTSGSGWGPDAATRAPLLTGTDAQRALEPDALVRVGRNAWRHASRTDFAAWPARGALRGDASLLRRALVTWARPRADVRLSATPGTPQGPPPGPPQLLYAGRLDGRAVVLLYDGLRVARYAEPLTPGDGSRAAKDGISLELARAAGAGTAASAALAVSRGEDEVRYLTAPWIGRAAHVDLLDPEDRTGSPLARDADGVTEPVPLPVTQPRHCTRWPGLLLSGSAHLASRAQLYTDLGEPVPARLTDGTARDPATGRAARGRLARTVCHLPAVLDSGVKTVSSWEFARQRLPDGDGEAAWVCTRAATWRGAGARVMTQFQPPAAHPGRPGAVTSRAEDTRTCGPRSRQILTGLLWKSTRGHWYVLAAGDPRVTRLRARGTGLVEGPARADGNTLAARAAGRDTSVRLSAQRRAD